MVWDFGHSKATTMALVPQSPFLSPLKPINTSLPPTKIFFTFRNLKVFSSLGPPSAEEKPSEAETQLENDDLKLEFAKANAYKKDIDSNPSKPTPKTAANRVQESDEVDQKNKGFVSENERDEDMEVPPAVRLAFEKAKEYKKKKDFVGNSNSVMEISEESSDVGRGNSGSLLNTLLKKSVGFLEESSSDNLKTEDNNNGNQEVPLAVKLALEKAKKYKENKGVVDSSPSMEGNDEISGVGRGKSGASLSSLLKKGADKKNESRSDEFKSDDKGIENKEVPLAVKLALEKAKKYKEDKGVPESSKPMEGREDISGLPKEDGLNSATTSFKNKANKKEELRVSNIDFVGLGFSDKKKSRGLPAGLVPVADSFPEGDLPEVEILVGDTSKFGDGIATEAPSTKEDDLELYKPKVSTWGVFPRPNNISKTFGGGRNIRPGEALETTQDKAAKDARTRQLVAAYNSKIGLNIDPKLKSECEKALKDGDALMDLGKLKEALPFYEKIMAKLAFQSELYGLAALQWSICQDSLSRPNEARLMYEKLQSHPNAQVSKKARQFVFGFQAMEMMKVKSSMTSPVSKGYQSYFEAFVKDKANYSSKDSEVDEGTLSQAIPYILFLISPILVVLIIAVQKGAMN